jgi:hypothetical protein
MLLCVWYLGRGTIKILSFTLTRVSKMAAMKNLLIEVLELTERGYSVEFIARVTGLQPYVVEYVVAEYGVAEPAL